MHIYSSYRYVLIILAMIIGTSVNGQNKREKIELDGELVTQIIENGDTILTYDLDNITVSIPRVFENTEEYRKYRRYRQYATKVYPFAVESIKIFREMENATLNMKKRDRKKYIKTLRKKAKKEFKDPLKKLSRTQGKILIKMIERELETNMFLLLKELNGGFSASKWQTVGKLYGYNLKDGYVPGIDRIMDAILQDFDISHEIK